jgi:Domain of unknown function (DUF5134)
VIRVFNLPALTWTLTAVLLLGGAYNLVQAVRARHLTDRINNTLHALMHTLMAAMLWGLAPATTLAQITLLAGAALWFTLQAVARPQFKLLCNGTPGKLKCAYHSLTMAAAATMITLMTTHTTPTTPEAGTAGPTHPTADTTGMADMPGMHHTTTAHTITTPDTTTITALGHTPALLLTLTFTAAAATFLTLLLRHHHTTKTTNTHQGTHQGTHQKTTRTDHALETLSATTMALMFATMTT